MLTAGQNIHKIGRKNTTDVYVFCSHHEKFTKLLFTVHNHKNTLTNTTTASWISSLSITTWIINKHVKEVRKKRRSIFCRSPEDRHFLKHITGSMSCKLIFTQHLKTNTSRSTNSLNLALVLTISFILSLSIV